MKNIVLIRCVRFDERIGQLVKMLRETVPRMPVYAVIDCYGSSAEQVAQASSQFPCETLPLNTSFISNHGLHFLGRDTGWKCGDYVIYRALHIEWDYAWVIEPDVFFLNGATHIFENLADSDHDLICADYREAEEQWYWRRSLADLLDSEEVYAMSFPLVRVSRGLAQASMSLRQEISKMLKTGTQVPNDEAVVATAANRRGKSVLDLKTRYPSYFRYWSTVFKFPVSDIKLDVQAPVIVHGGLDKDRFSNYLFDTWLRMGEGWVEGRRRLLFSLSFASSETKGHFLNRIIDYHLNTSATRSTPSMVAETRDSGDS